MANSTVINTEVIDQMLKEIGNALIASDVNVKLVLSLRKQIKDTLNLEEMGGGLNRRRMVHQVVFDQLCKLLDPGIKPYQPQKGKPNVVMFVGLQGSGKTTTVTKLAHYYKRLGFKACLVCADTFRAGAYDQLKQNATQAKIPYFGSYVESDPVKVSKEGVDGFKQEGYDMIIVDTSGRHKQEEELFEEMQQISQAITPTNVIFVMDGAIGQAAHDQALAFRQKVSIGSVIITKLDGHAKGGGALSAVAATQSPIIFIGTGEHIEDLEPFVAKSFVSKLLGMGDVSELIKRIKDVVPKDQQPEMMNRISQGVFTLRDMYDQFQNILKMGPLNKVMEMVPGMSNLLKQAPGGGNVDSSYKIKMFMTIMDSMTNEELDNSKLFSAKAIKDSRIQRIARGSGRSIKEVNELLDQFKHFEKVMGKLKGMNIPKNGKIAPRNLAQMTNMMPAGLVKQMGFGNIQNMMRSMGNMGNMGNMANMFNE
eukprot:TRINITY_DN9874_c0_g1_i1.p1 TRINITY_DN9874_c0_g1~~TRINITY_DN9874_c0_g1_i1.p1  ORF type:complete len:502 (+),score=100.51 TRINITY_DN9874_c0_g1_i1:69-1508(+)